MSKITLSYIIGFIWGIICGIIVCSISTKNTYSSSIDNNYQKNTERIIIMQDSMIKVLSDKLWFEYDDDLPEFDGDYNIIVEELKETIGWEVDND